jgi:hypothetical protein
MKLNTKIALKNFKGEDIKIEKEVITVSIVLSNILASTQENPQKSWFLGKEIATKDEVTLKAEDIVFIKKQIESNKQYTALITGQIIEMLDK